MKRLISLALVLVMLAAMFASCTKGNTETSATTDTSATTESGVGGNETITDGVYDGIEGKDYRDPAEYTYLDYIGGTTGLNWNPHAWETSDDSYVISYITTALYDFVLNEDITGYTIIPEAAAALPEDVTAEYVGQYGIVEGETAKAWKIALNPTVKWTDGTPINAETYVYSMKQLLDPVALNRRADSFYSGDFEVVNAKAYFYNGKISYNVVGSDLATYMADGTTLYVPAWSFYGLQGCVDADGNECPEYLPYNDTTLYRDIAVEDENEDGAWVSGADIYAYFAPGGVYESYAPEYLYVEQSLPKVTFDEVGIKALDDYTILIVTAKPTAEAEFYVPYHLSSAWLVKADLYESCQTWFDAAGNVVAAGSPDAVSVTNTYCTSVATSACYGPYDLTYYELDKQLTFTRNDTWFGYHDDTHFGQYQTDKISCQVISEHKTALQAFLNG